MEWTPVLADDPLATDARAALAEIAAALSSSLPPGPYDLAEGKAGLALFFGTLARAEPGSFRHHEPTALALLEAAQAQVAGELCSPSLLHGFPGVAWVGDHLRRLYDAADPDINADVDDAVISWLESESDPGFDVTTGVTGVGVYALERVGTASADRCLELAVDRLVELSSRGGDSFWTPRGSLPAELATSFPDGCWDLGLAHGVPGVISFLARCVAIDRVGERARRLLAHTGSWLRSRRRGDEQATAFAAIEAPGCPPRPARSGWCYGDAAIALALIHAARALRRPDWQTDAIAIAHRAADRPEPDTGVVDAGICHGAAGLAHIFGRLHQLTGDAALRGAAQTWLVRTLGHRAPAGEQPNTGRIYRRALDGSAHPAPDLMTGAAGVGLVLLAATSDLAPAWDRALLLAP